MSCSDNSNCWKSTTTKFTSEWFQRAQYIFSVFFCFLFSFRIYSTCSIRAFPSDSLYKEWRLEVRINFICLFFKKIIIIIIIISLFWVLFLMQFEQEEDRIKKMLGLLWDGPPPTSSHNDFHGLNNCIFIFFFKKKKCALQNF